MSTKLIKPYSEGVLDKDKDRKVTFDDADSHVVVLFEAYVIRAVDNAKFQYAASESWRQIKARTSCQ